MAEASALPSWRDRSTVRFTWTYARDPASVVKTRSSTGSEVSQAIRATGLFSPNGASASSSASKCAPGSPHPRQPPPPLRLRACCSLLRNLPEIRACFLDLSCESMISVSGGLPQRYALAGSVGRQLNVCPQVINKQAITLGCSMGSRASPRKAGRRDVVHWLSAMAFQNLTSLVWRLRLPSARFPTGTATQAWPRLALAQAEVRLRPHEPSTEGAL